LHVRRGNVVDVTAREEMCGAAQREQPMSTEASCGGRCLHPINESRASADDHVTFVDHVGIRNELVAWPEHSSRAWGVSEARIRHRFN
jgi:hypothetical protein